MLAVFAALATIVLGFLPYGGGVPEHRSAMLELFVAPTEPSVLITLAALMTVLCGLRRRGRDAVLCVLGAVIPVLLNTFVLKYLFAHHLKGYLAYPSGHTVSLVAPLTVLVLLAGKGIPRMVTAVIAVVITVLAGIGLVGLGYHAPLDVAGGACFAVAAVLTLSLWLRPGPARSAGSPRAGTSSGSPPAASPR